MRKPRSDSPLANLPEYQREQLIAWLLDDGIGYAEAKNRLHQDFNITTSETALGGFYRHFCQPLRLRRCAQAATDLPELAGGLTTNWDAPSIALVKQTYFEILSAPVVDPKQVAVFAMQIADINRGQLERSKLKTRRQEAALRARLKRKDQALSQAKFNSLERRNAEAREKLNAIVQAKGGLTPQTISQIEETLKLL